MLLSVLFAKLLQAWIFPSGEWGAVRVVTVSTTCRSFEAYMRDLARVNSVGRALLKSEKQGKMCTPIYAYQNILTYK